jgi:hypothetical protein
MPGAEFTTYGGHATLIGTTQWVDHRIGVRGASIAGAILNVHDQGGLFSINHPAIHVGDACIGCGWDHPVVPRDIDGVEVQSGVFPGVMFWEDLVRAGLARGGDRRQRRPPGGSGHRCHCRPAIGSPTTMVYADELSVEAIVRACGTRARW